MRNTLGKIFWAAASAVLIAGCGGGGAGTAPTPTAKHAVITKGRIARFGSVIVNGVEYQTSTAQIKVNGQPAASQNSLAIGETVTVVGDAGQNGQGSATMINFDAQIEGPISSIDTTKNQFVALGQTVIVDTATVFNGVKGLSDLKVNDVVEVSGPRDSSQAIHAGFVELTGGSATGPVQLQGTIQGLDTTAKTFLLGSQSIDYSSAVLEPASLVLANGLMVEVKGTLSGAAIKAAKVSQEESMHADAGEDEAVEGLITSVDSATQFVVDGVTVLVSSATHYENGTVADIAVNKRVEVEGVTDSSGKLQATQVQFAEKPFVEIQADVQGVDTSAKSLGVLGLTLYTTDDTSFRKDDDQTASFTLADIRTGDHLKIGASVEGGKLVAKVIQRESPSAISELQADVQSIDSAAHLISLHGVKVSTSGATFKGRDEKTITESDFYAQVKNGDVVKAVGPFDGQAIKATAVSLEAQQSNDDQQSTHG